MSSYLKSVRGFCTLLKCSLYFCSIIKVMVAAWVKRDLLYNNLHIYASNVITIFEKPLKPYLPFLYCCCSWLKLMNRQAIPSSCCGVETSLLPTLYGNNNLVSRRIVQKHQSKLWGVGSGDNLFHDLETRTVSIHKWAIAEIKCYLWQFDFLLSLCDCWKVLISTIDIWITISIFQLVNSFILLSLSLHIV